MECARVTWQGNGHFGCEVEQFTFRLRALLDCGKQRMLAFSSVRQTLGFDGGDHEWAYLPDHAREQAYVAMQRTLAEWRKWEMSHGRIDDEPRQIVYDHPRARVFDYTAELRQLLKGTV